jgi:Tfp pilus assembly protein PilF
MPRSVLPGYWCGWALVEGRRVDEARALFGQLAETHPESARVAVALAERLAKDGRTDEAIARLREALDVADAGVRGGIHSILAGVYQGAGRNQEAMAHYRKAVAKRPDDFWSLNNLAWLIATTGEAPAEALALAERAADISGGNVMILDTLAWIHYLNDDADRAVAILEKIRPALGAVAEMRYHLGMAYLKQGERDKARRELEQALSLSPDFPHADEVRETLDSL